MILNRLLQKLLLPKLPTLGLLPPLSRPHLPNRLHRLRLHRLIPRHLRLVPRLPTRLPNPLPARPRPSRLLSRLRPLRPR